MKITTENRKFLIFSLWINSTNKVRVLKKRKYEFVRELVHVRIRTGTVQSTPVRYNILYMLLKKGFSCLIFNDDLANRAKFKKILDKNGRPILSLLHQSYIPLKALFWKLTPIFLLHAISFIRDTVKFWLVSLFCCPLKTVSYTHLTLPTTPYV